MQNKLSKNGSTKAQMPVQRNETLNTDESTQVGQYTGKTEPEKNQLDGYTNTASLSCTIAYRKEIP